MLKFCLDFFGPIEKQLEEKAKVNFKIYHVIYEEANNYNTHITQHLKNNIFLQNSCRK